MKNNETIIWIVIAIAIILIFSGFNMMGFGSMMPRMFGYGFPFGWIFMALVTAALVLLIIWLIKQIQNPRRRK